MSESYMFVFSFLVTFFLIEYNLEKKCLKTNWLQALKKGKRPSYKTVLLRSSIRIT